MTAAEEEIAGIDCVQKFGLREEAVVQAGLPKTDEAWRIGTETEWSSSLLAV